MTSIIYFLYFSFVICCTIRSFSIPLEIVQWANKVLCYVYYFCNQLLLPIIRHLLSSLLFAFHFSNAGYTFYFLSNFTVFLPNPLFAIFSLFIIVLWSPFWSSSYFHDMSKYITQIGSLVTFMYTKIDMLQIKYFFYFITLSSIIINFMIFNQIWCLF